MDYLSLAEKKQQKNKSNEVVDRAEAAGKSTDFNNAMEEINSVSNGIDDTILKKDERSLNEPTRIGKNDVSKSKNNSNFNSLC